MWLRDLLDMAELTLTQRFGSSVAFNATAKTLTINLADLADSGDITTGRGLDVSTMTDANKDTYSSRILWALLSLSEQNQPEANNDENIGVYVTNEGKRNVSRNGVAQFGFRKVATAHINDNLGTTLDPDQIAA